MVKNLPSNAGDEGSVHGQGNKIPHVMGQVSRSASAKEPVHSKARAPQRTAHALQ